MPKLAEFYGIEILMYPREHNPPHFHAYYGDYEAVVEISPIRLSEGWLPPRAASLVVEWAGLRQSELLRAWEQRAMGMKIDRIEPLP